MNEPHVTNSQGRSGLASSFGTVTAVVELAGTRAVVVATVMM